MVPVIIAPDDGATHVKVEAPVAVAVSAVVGDAQDKVAVNGLIATPVGALVSVTTVTIAVPIQPFVGLVTSTVYVPPAVAVIADNVLVPVMPGPDQL